MTESQTKPDDAEPALLHHEYDGIREYDNPLPRWWVWIFWSSMYFAAGYLLWYHVLPNGKSIAVSYDDDMADYREWLTMKDMGAEVTEDALSSLMQNADVMADARKIFEARCVQCHAAQGQGNIGPNLTDAFWIHGEGRLMDIYKVAHDGVPAKGMPAWSRQLTPMELRKVVGYVGTLRGKNVPGKGPEGKQSETAVNVTPTADRGG
jgi:cytochrome c oxidase cbb3-type subunit 3